MKNKRMNPALEKALIKNQGFSEGMDKGFQGALLLMILALKNVQTEREYIPAALYPEYVQLLEREMKRIFDEQFDADPKQTIHRQQSDLYDLADSTLYHIGKERERLGMEALDG